MSKKKNDEKKPAKAAESAGAGPKKSRTTAREKLVSLGRKLTGRKSEKPEPAVPKAKATSPAPEEKSAGKKAAAKPVAKPTPVRAKPAKAPAPPKPAAPRPAPPAAPAPSARPVAPSPPAPPQAPPPPPPVAKPTFHRDLPSEYGDTKVVALVRDPEWAFLYWEIAEADRQRFGIPRGAHARSLGLRVYDVTGIHFDGENAHSFFDVGINDFATSWYLRIPESDRAYVMDLGVYDEEGNFQMIARSNAISVPPAAMSAHGGEEWMNITEEQFAEIFRLSGGLRLREQAGSAEFGKRKPEEMLAELRRQWVGSGMWSGASGAIPKAPGKRRGFWLEVGCDVIIYGATEPGAKVTLQGRMIQLSPDGRFHARFTLPDGTVDMPVQATSPDGEETRAVNPVVTRQTH